MREAWRLVEPIVLARAAARALLAVLFALLVGAPSHVWAVAAVLGLAAGATPFVERAAVLRALARSGISFRAAWEASGAATGLWALALLQLLLLGPGGGAGLDAHTSALARALVELKALQAHQLGLIAFGVLAAGALLGAPSGTLALDRLAARRPDPAAPSVWILLAAGILGLLAAVATVIDRGLLGAKDGVVVGAIVWLAASLVLPLVTFLVFVVDRAADGLAGMAGAPPSEVESLLPLDLVGDEDSPGQERGRA